MLLPARLHADVWTRDLPWNAHGSLFAMSLVTMKICLGLAALVLASTAVACGYNTSFTPTNVPPHPLAARAEASVEMFTATAPKRPYVEVGLISSQHDGMYSLSSDDEVMLGLRKKAAQIGCDAVVVTAETGNLVGTVSSNTVNTRTLKSFRAVCAMYTDASSAQSETKESAQ
jgi:hypothetical protein